MWSKPSLVRVWFEVIKGTTDIEVEDSSREKEEFENEVVRVVQGNEENLINIVSRIAGSYNEAEEIEKAGSVNEGYHSTEQREYPWGNIKVVGKIEKNIIMENLMRNKVVTNVSKQQKRLYEVCAIKGVDLLKKSAIEDSSSESVTEGNYFYQKPRKAEKLSEDYGHIGHDRDNSDDESLRDFKIEVTRNHEIKSIADEKKIDDDVTGKNFEEYCIKVIRDKDDNEEDVERKENTRKFGDFCEKFSNCMNRKTETEMEVSQFEW